MAKKNNLTLEQQLALDTILNDDCSLLQISARAGSGKTKLLVDIANAFSDHEGMYLAYNKQVADESSEKFPKHIKCMTTHSLAYRYIVTPAGLKVKTIRPQDIDIKKPRADKLMALELVRLYCLSDSTDFKSFYEQIGLSRSIIDTATYVLKAMQLGIIECSHEFYLKLFHLALHHKVIKLKTHLLMLDEAGDLNPVTLAIFKCIDAKKKVLVGDNHQNIYSFNNTINGFEALKGEGTLLELTQSFRVNKDIAKGVERFCQTYLCRHVKFIGVDHSSEDIVSKAILFRTNSAMIETMIDLNNKDIKYNLARDPKSIFELPLLLASLKRDSKITANQYRYLQPTVDHFNYHYDQIMRDDEKMTLLRYIAKEFNDDKEIVSACRVVFTHKIGPILEANRIAMEDKHSRVKHPLTLSSAHSSKGMEWDEVTISDDLNDAVRKALDSMIERIDSAKLNDINRLDYEPLDQLNENERGEMRLYYVACTRAKHILKNAVFIDQEYF